MSGYNEDAYKEARTSAIALPCPFERALLSRCVTCFKSRRLLLAEREAVTCTEQAANGACKAFHAALHENARFALHMDPHQRWPFGKEIRAQCGGIQGLSAILGQEDMPVDVAVVVSQGLERYAGVDQFPYSEIMRSVVHFEPRKKKG